MSTRHHISRRSARQHRADIASGLIVRTESVPADRTKFEPTPRAPQNRPAPHGRTLSGLPKRTAL